MSAAAALCRRRWVTAVTGEPQYLYLTTLDASGLPREIEIWFTRRGERYYLVAEHGEEAGWVKNLRARPAVRVRVSDVELPAQARVVDALVEPALAADVRARSEAKYGWGDGLVVEIVPDAAPAGSPPRPRTRS